MPETSTPDGSSSIRKTSEEDRQTERYRELISKFERSPYAQLMGTRIVELSEGYVKVSMTVQESHLNFAGLLHGGVTMSLADEAFACATNTLNGLYVAVQFNMNFFATAKPGDELVAECRVIHAGRSLGVAEMTVADSSGKLIARATGTVANVRRDGVPPSSP